MFGLGGSEVVLVLIIALVFLGPKKLPELAHGLGKAFREFQKAKNDFSDQLQQQIAEVEDKTDESVKTAEVVGENKTDKLS